MAFTTLWFILVAVLWTGFFVLEGFDLGVGMLHGLLSRKESSRQAVLHTIGPVWDGNEVWLVTAGAAMFAAFPGWYATLFSGFYLALVLLLAGLIVRGIAIEYRGRVDSVRWRRSWTVLLTVGSVTVPLVLGIALGDLLHGVPIGRDQEYEGTFADLFTGYGIFTGITLTALCLLHGATFLALKTSGDIREKARRLARRIAVPAGLVVLAFVFWTRSLAGGGILLNLAELAAVLAVVAAAWLISGGHDGWAFGATTLAMAATVASLFAELFPRVMVSSTSGAFDLTVHNTASGPYALKVLTVVVLVLLPVVLCYQGWTYHVFRQRISADHFPTQGQPATPSTGRPDQ
ncbi:MULTISPECIES: cytochrome d ubiquinol oxidase subunit II [unclassified Streptomyces]|uniref:cytochrome d ubiquinol oxidase subunit II n=1 Tax=unclassified Streptomyces TaxID=2593676 RepID=UPI00224E5BD5|nr:MULTISPECIES: cytochrome d ubiquinol oxidase subunit II [unclassified Streptomyces]MCX4993058.1 cytochrome d ubiquinol oxidase subunit II [Streptomyces sp. NBC_00568]MCX5001706.1 cytochrome d ubiquinol oxidase subunit II [Streptomyces sp. NBC_00638]